MGGWTSEGDSSPGNLPTKVVPVWQIKQELIPHFKDGEAEAGLR